MPRDQLKMSDERGILQIQICRAKTDVCEIAAVGGGICLIYRALHPQQQYRNEPKVGRPVHSANH